MADTFDVSSGKATIVKDPNAVLDYVFDWSTWLDALPDTIASRDVVVEDGACTVVQSVINGKTVVVWLSGGTVNSTCRVRCRITTNSTPARVDDRTIYVKIRER